MRKTFGHSHHYAYADGHSLHYAYVDGHSLHYAYADGHRHPNPDFVGGNCFSYHTPNSYPNTHAKARIY